MGKEERRKRRLQKKRRVQCKKRQREEWSRAHKGTLLRAKRISYHLLSVAVIVGILLMGVFRAPGSCLRFWESLRDLWTTFFGVSTVTQLPQGMTEGFPRELAELAEIVKRFGALFIDAGNLKSYVAQIGEILLNTAYVLTYAALPLCLLFLLAWSAIHRRNRRYGAKSKPLRAFLCVRQNVFVPVGRYLKGWKKFFFGRKKYILSAVLISLLFLNVYTILLGTLSYYFYFLLSDSLTLGIGSQIIKLIYDVVTAFQYLPLWLWAFIGLWIFDAARKEIGYRRLERLEEDLRKFLEERGVNILVCGAPRTGKTTTLVSIVKSLMAMSRQNAKSGMRDLNRKFPDFPWIVLEKMIRKDYERHEFRNLYHLSRWLDMMIENGRSGGKKWLRRLRRKYRACSAAPIEYPYFNYDIEHFKSVHSEGLGEETIDDAVRDYAALYLIYIQPMLILANFSIRSDDDFMDLGNFPEWRDDFFRHEPDPLSVSHFAKILNQDLIRPGKQVDPKCEYANSFEFGILTETEVGKERGNQFDREGKKKGDAEANILNDKRDDMFKLMGHLGTIYNIRFALYVGDEQRPESWGANARELCDVLTIRKRGPDKILMPFFAFEELFYLIVHKLFGSFYDAARFNRGDTTFIVYLLAHLSKLVEDHYHYIVNRFGGHFLKINVSLAMRQDGDNDAMSKGKVFIANAKVYSQVFRSAAWNKFMEERARKSECGIEDIPEFQDLDASFDEFIEMRSYFFRDLVKMFASREEQISAWEFFIGKIRATYAAIAGLLETKRANELFGDFCRKLLECVKDKSFEKMKETVESECEILLQTAKKEKPEQE